MLARIVCNEVASGRNHFPFVLSVETPLQLKTLIVQSLESLSCSQNYYLHTFVIAR